MDAQFDLRVPNGMLFVYDYEMKGVIIPEYDENSITSQSINSISISVIHEIEGEVNISVASLDYFSNHTGSNVSEHTIELVQPFLTICMIGEERLVGLRAKPGKCRVVVTWEGAPFPTTVRIYIEQPTP